MRRLKNALFKRKCYYICAPLRKINGALAQLVEQRTENPCVPGSIPGGTTTKARNEKLFRAFLMPINCSGCFGIKKNPPLPPLLKFTRSSAISFLKDARKISPVAQTQAVHNFGDIHFG